MSLRRAAFIVLLALSVAEAGAGQQQPPPGQQPQKPSPAAPQTNLGSDANGNPLRRALKTGHVSNYDESKVKPYTLPDPLVFADGTPVRTARDWMTRRRPEIIRAYEQDIFGRVPANTPRVTWLVTEDHGPKKQIVGTIGDAPNAPRINVTLTLPLDARGPVPVVLLLNFGGGGAPVADPPVAADILRRGWGYATAGYNDIQPDRINAFDRGVIGATSATPPGPGEWGTISAWAWGASRIIDYLALDKAVDAKRIALYGHSRLGKTALWASALDDRIAAVFSSCSGEMGAALSRRDWGETVDDMAQNFPYWFVSDFSKWAGRWNEMPVDAHMLIALSAPRPVFITGGTADQWADPVGEFLAGVAAGPVYRLLDKKDLGVTTLPPLDVPVTAGDLGWHYHTGPHAATPADWQAFLVFLDKYFPSAIPNPKDAKESKRESEEPPVAAAAAKRTITHDDVFTMARTSRPVVSPDGKWIVYNVTEPSYDPAKTIADLWIVAPDGRTPPRRLTLTKEAESGAAWSPDSKSVAFAAKRDGDQVDQIYVMAVDGGEARRVTTSATAASGPKWRPDGKALLFESLVKPSGAPSDKSTARVYDAMPIRYWNAWLDGSKPRIFVQELGGGPAADWLAGTKLAAASGFDGVFTGDGATRGLQPVWAPDGQEIVFVAVTNRDLMMREDVPSRVYRMKKGQEPIAFGTPGGSYAEPAFSPDGRVLVAKYEKGASAAQPYTLARLARFDWPSAAAPRGLTDTLDRGVGSFTIARDSASVLFDAQDEGFTQVYRVRLAGGAPARVFTVKEGNYGSPAEADGAIVGTYVSSTQPAEIVRLDPAAASHALLTDANRAVLDALDLPKPEHFWFTAKNGKRIHSMIYLPPALDRTRKYPLLVMPHGGPNAMDSDNFSVRWNAHLLTAPGYVLIQTNYTGSTGFGEKFADAIERDVLRGPALEVLEGAQETIKRHAFIDATRQCALGASYGGYLMNWFNGHTNQFRCLVIHAGASNNQSQYGVNDGGIAREWRMGGPVWDGKGQWMDQSPFRYAATWKTPALITQGELDFRVPLNESITTFKLLQRQGVRARLLTFPDEGHWILKGENARRHLAEIHAWLRAHLQPGT